MNREEKVNLICKMAANIFSGIYKEATTYESVFYAFDILDDVEAKLSQQEKLKEREGKE